MLNDFWKAIKLIADNYIYKNDLVEVEKFVQSLSDEELKNLLNEDIDGIIFQEAKMELADRNWERDKKNLEMNGF